MKNRLTSLDGLRGAAILGVLLFHFTPHRPSRTALDQAFAGVVGLGWTGVDLFFVLSGFLITGILLAAKGSGGYFKNFYMRRVLRIFPLYYGTIAVCVFLMPRLGFHDAAPTGSSLWWWLYLSNVKASFFDARGAGWFGYYWSLAVEEHFYLLWPLMIYLCTRRAAFAWCVACIAIACVARSAFAYEGHLLAGYYFTLSRMDSLAAGSLAAVVASRPGGLPAIIGRVKVAFVAFGLAALGVSIWRHSYAQDAGMQVFGFPAITGFYTALVLLAADAPNRGRVFRAVLEARVLRFFGRYSYGLYVMHGSFIAVLVTWLPPPRPFGPAHEWANDGFVAAILVGYSLALAIPSYHLIEMPFLKLKRHFEYSGPPAREAHAPVQSAPNTFVQ
jgi:peptidoglycan/LPS O-acetylase OafA/YrhL